MIDEKVYRGHYGISQSDLKLLEKDPMKFYRSYVLKHSLKSDDEETIDMQQGTLIDDYITAKNEFYKKYLGFAGSLGAKLQSVADEIIESFKEKLFNPNSAEYLNNGKSFKDFDLSLVGVESAGLKPYVINIARRLEYQSNYKDDTLFAHIMDKAEPYFSVVRNHPDKIIVPASAISNTETLVNQIKNPELANANYINQTYGQASQLIRWLHGDDPIPSHLEIKTQVIYLVEDYIVFPPSAMHKDGKRVAIKGKIDIEIINHKRNTRKVLDLKKAKDRKTLYNSYIDSRYPLQLDFYNHLASICNITSGIESETPSLLVIFPEQETKAAIITPSEKDLLVGRLGNDLKGRVPIAGWASLLKEYVFREVNNVWTGHFVDGGEYLEDCSASINKELSILGNPRV